MRDDGVGKGIARNLFARWRDDGGRSGEIVMMVMSAMMVMTMTDYDDYDGGRMMAMILFQYCCC